MTQDTWFEVGVARVVTVKAFEGGLSAFVKNLLEHAFFNSSSHDVSKAGVGVTLLCNGRRKHLWMELRYVVADEAALHYIYCCKGSAGIKCCMNCSNIFNYGYRDRKFVEDDPTGTNRYHTTHEFNALVLHTSESIDVLWNTLKAAKDAAAPNFGELEKRLGWNYDVNCVMHDPVFRKRIDPVSRVTWDPMHCFFVSGVFNHCAGRLMKAMQTAKVNTLGVENYFKAWKHPRAYANGKQNNVAAVFAPERLKQSLIISSLKCTASDALGVFPILALFCCSMLSDESIGPHCQCFLKLALVLGRWQRAARRLTTAHDFRDAIVDFLQCYATLYGCEAMTIKFHYILHLPMQWDRILSCWVHERKHRSIKRFADHVQNLKSSWENSVLREVTGAHLSRLIELDGEWFDGKPKLLAPVRPQKKMHALLQTIFGDACSFRMSPQVIVDEWREKICVKDVVMMRTDSTGSVEIGEVLWHAEITADTVFHKTSIKCFRLVSEQLRAFKVEHTDDVRVIDTALILCACVYAGKPGELCSVLKPLHCCRYPLI